MSTSFYRVPSRSFKVASPTQPVGTLVQDRQAAIAGVIGSHPSFIPVNANIQTMDGKVHSTPYEVIRHRDFSTLYTLIPLWYIIDGIEIYSGDHSVSVEAKILLKDQAESEIAGDCAEKRILL